MVGEMPAPQVTQLPVGYSPPPSTPIKRKRSASRWRVHPWQVDLLSIFGAALCVGAGIALALGNDVTAAVLFPLGALCDLFDGRLARMLSTRIGEPRKFGAFLDSMCDKVGEAALFIGIVVAIEEKSILLLAAAAFAFASLTSYTKAVAGEHRIDISWPEARVAGRAGRAFLLSLLLVLSATLPGQRQEVYTLLLGTLLVFNSASFFWRLGRVVTASHGAQAAEAQAELPTDLGDKPRLVQGRLGGVQVPAGRGRNG